MSTCGHSPVRHLSGQAPTSRRSRATAVDPAGHHPTRVMVGRTGRGDACVALFFPSPEPIPGPGAAGVAHPSRHGAPMPDWCGHPMASDGRGARGAGIRWPRMPVGHGAGGPVPHSMIGGRDEKRATHASPLPVRADHRPGGTTSGGVPHRRYRPDPGDHGVTLVSRNCLKSP